MLKNRSAVKPSEAGEGIEGGAEAKTLEAELEGLKIEPEVKSQEVVAAA